MEICSEFLHCTHEEFGSLSYDEKSKWYSFIEMKIARQSDIEKRNREKKQHQDTHAQSTIENRKRNPTGPKLKGRQKK